MKTNRMTLLTGAFLFATGIGNLPVCGQSPPQPMPAPKLTAPPLQAKYDIRPQPAPPPSVQIRPVSAYQPMLNPPIPTSTPPHPVAPPQPLPMNNRERLPPPLASPQPIPELTLETLDAIAQTENPSIARAASLFEAARGNWVQVGLAPNPSAGYEGQQLGSGGRAEQHGIWVEQELVRGGKLRVNREIAAQEIGRANQELTAQRQRVSTDVRILFYQALIAQRQEQLTNDLAANAAQNMTASETLFKQKEVGRLDVLQAQVEVRNSQILMVNARNRRAAAWQSLTTVLGRSHWHIQTLAGDLEAIPQYSWKESLDRLVSSSPEIGIALTNIERARWRAERARIEKIPNVTLRGMVNPVDNGINGDPDGSLSIGVPLPIWNRNQGALTQAQHEAAAAERALEQLELSLQNRLAPVYERYSNALNQVKEYRENILPAATETLALSRRLYQAGEAGFLNVLTAQRTYSETNLAYLEAQRELRTSAAEIEGMLLSGSLQNGGAAP